MSLHQIEYSYKIQEWGNLEMDLDPAMDLTEREAVAIAEIKEIYDDITDIEILDVKEIN